MKWFKHISDSLDDPFIFDLINRFGSDGYLVFFGILEIYSREFKPKNDWKLTVTRSYLRQKLHKRQDTIIIKCLIYIATHGTSSARVRHEFGTSLDLKTELPANSRQTPDKLPTNSKKVYQNSGKWDVTFNGEQVTIFIPKFTQITDEWTKRKLRSDNGGAPKILTPDKEEEEEVEEEVSSKEDTRNCPYLKIIKIYHKKLPMLPVVENHSKDLKDRLRTRWKEDTQRQNLDWWQWYFEGVSKCDFLIGKVKDWSASFYWLTGPKNMTKVLNGEYLNRTKQSKTDQAMEDFVNERVKS